ncbi:MAG TPA: hypothetical protein VMP01_25400 [Pirellulaceae bacterium]|nr:hypothetical protein [Pirellulaceae bacterium]
MISHRACGSVALVGSLFLLGTWTSDALAQPRRVKTRGQVVSVVRDVVTLVDEGKNRHQVRPKADTGQVEISGPWEAAKLQPGMIIRLNGVVKSNEIEDQVTELVVHSPLDQYQLGIAQDIDDQPATILGQFVRIKDGRLTVSLGKRRINARLAKDATITVESKDLAFVKPGDAIEIDSYTTNSGILSGRTIKVTIQPVKSLGNKSKGKNGQTARPPDR